MATPSVYSYSSTRDFSQYVKDLHGRNFNTLNEAYPLPSDESEWGRLDKQHIALGIGMGGALTPCQEVVDALLVPEDGKQKKVLDIGCGTGTWCIEMAKRYPHVSVIGIDLAPTPVPETATPANLSFDIADANHDLDQFHGQFDVVHMRSAMTGIHDIDKTVKDIQHCLKQGGLIILMCADIQIYSEDRIHAVKIPDPEKEGPNSEGSWFHKILWETCQGNRISGASWDRSAELIDLGLWNDPLSDPDTAAAGSIYLPIGSWPTVPDRAQSDLLGYAGQLMRQVLLNIHRAYHSSLLKHGMDQDVINGWSEKVEDEITNLRVKIWLRFRFCWARRRAGPNLPAPPLLNQTKQDIQNGQHSENAEVSGGKELEDGGSEMKGRVKYPYFIVHLTPEEAAAETKLRAESAPQYPESELRRAWAKKQVNSTI